MEDKRSERGGRACTAVRGNVRTGRVSAETRLVELKGNAACRRVCVSAALCYTERLVSQSQTAGGEKRRGEAGEDEETRAADLKQRQRSCKHRRDSTRVRSALFLSQVK